MVMIPNPALPIHASADERSSLAMSSPRRKRGSIHLPISAGAFVALICVAILVLSGWREWSSREAELKNAEVDVANLSESLTQHADDTLELPGPKPSRGSGPLLIFASPAWGVSAVCSFTTRPEIGWQLLKP